MADKKYSIFQINGGLGKHIAATAVAQAIKTAHPDRELIVVCAWPELWSNLPFVHRVYVLGQTQYFYQEYILNADSLIFANEPYMNTDHIYKRTPLVQTWCNMYGIPYNGEKPVIKINPESWRLIEEFYKYEKPVMLIQTNGGFYADEKPYRWARDIPLWVAEKIAKKYRKDYQIVQVTRPTSPQINVPEIVVINQEVQNTELMGLLKVAKKRILIDSSMQHGAAALGLPSTVLWNATSPTIFGHEIHDNIQAKEKPDINLPGSYFFDYDFDGNVMEYPYEDGDEKDIFDMDKIYSSIDNQGNQEARGFKVHD
jgi:hypothetical protein